MTNNQATKEVVHKVRYKLKGILLFLIPSPLLLGFIISLGRGRVTDALLTGGLLASFLFAAVIARKGFKNEGEYEWKKFTKAPSVPYKTIAALLFAATTTIGAKVGADHSIFSSLIIGGVAFLGFVLSYGLDPRKNKMGNNTDERIAHEALEALETAENILQKIDRSRQDINNFQFNQRLSGITSKARTILNKLEEDPQDLHKARRFLKVYLEGTLRVTEGYAKTQKDGLSPNSNITENFGRVLDSIEETFDKQYKRLKEHHEFNLDVQLEVLETQLKQEGIR